MKPTGGEPDENKKHSCFNVLFGKYMGETAALWVT